MQALGCLIGTVAILLPSALLVLFFFPVWQHLKKFVVVLRALEGINAVVVGFMLAGGLFLFSGMGAAFDPQWWLQIAVIGGTFLLLRFTRVPAPAIVAGCLVLGLFF